MSSEELKNLIQDFEKNQKAVCQIVYFQPLQNQTSKLSLKDFYNSDCCIDFWIDGKVLVFTTFLLNFYNFCLLNQDLYDVFFI